MTVDPNIGHLLGDSGYGIRTYLLTPYPNPINAEQEAFNNSHKKTRTHIEHANGLVKKRFPPLSKDGLLRVDIRKACKVIMSFCILHNMALDNNDIFILEEGDIAADEFRFPPLPVQDSMEETRLTRLGKASRDMITQQYFK